LLKDIQHNLNEFETSGSDFLAEQFLHFRNEILRFYMEVEHFRENYEHRDNLETLLIWYKDLERGVEQYVQNTLKNTRKGRLTELEISDVLTVNRTIFRSNLMMITSTKSLYCNLEEMEDFERALEVKHVL
jgi:hypothetical protein